MSTEESIKTIAYYLIQILSTKWFDGFMNLDKDLECYTSTISSKYFPLNDWTKVR